MYLRRWIAVSNLSIFKATVVVCSLFFTILWLMPNDSDDISPAIISRSSAAAVVNELQEDLFDVGDPDKIYEREIRMYESHIIPGLGAMGAAATLPDELREIGEESLAKYALNAILSDRIPLHRKLGSFANPLCNTKKYDIRLKATVVIIFYNEIFSILIRTVWSILDGTPKPYLDEIILVDDNSDREELLGRLEYYIKTRFADFPVRLVRMSRRSGLIRARLHGARMASPQSDVLIFLDAHCEVTKNWIEPLLDRIQNNRTIVAIPIIDLLSETSFEYSTNGDTSFQVGGFTWDGTFDWIDIQPSELLHRKTEVDPVKTPTMAGGLFAIERNYFWEIGSYDEQMDGWGGENLELSFRIWQCGGSLQIIPCSRVGHVFRDFHPYRFPGNKDTHGINTARMAKVWMDKYQRLFFLHRQNLQNDAVIGDVTHRRIFREKMHCKSFDWYLKNIYPEKFIPDENVLAYGRVEHHESKLCLDDLQNAEKHIYPLGVYTCFQKLQATQLFSLSMAGELRKETTCAEVIGRGRSLVHKLVEMTKCHGQGGAQRWVLTKKSQIKNPGSGLCMDATLLTDGAQMFVTPCSDSKGQKLAFDTVVPTYAYVD